TGMGDRARLELLYQRKVVLLVGGDCVLTGIGDPDIAVLIVDGHAIDSVDATLTIATAWCSSWGDLRDDFERFRVHLEKRRLLDGRAADRRGDEEDVVLGAISSLVEARNKLGVHGLELFGARN